MAAYSAVSSDLTSFVSAMSLPVDSPAARSRRMTVRSLHRDLPTRRSLGISLISIPPYTYKGKRGETAPKDIENIFIDPSAKVVGEKAFSGCAKLGSIVIPSSVTAIQQNAFYGCTSLTSIVIPESVNSIAAYAFHGCNSLSPISIPSSVTTIGRNAFYRCTSLETLVIPESVTSIGELAFSECTSLKSVVLPSTIRTIAWGAFSRCSALASIVIPDGVTTIDWGAFAECPSLAFVSIPTGIVAIGESAFEGCTSLSVVAIPELLPSVGDRSFGECPLLDIGASALGTDIFGWLRTRFDFMPVHQVCYRPDVSREKIADCLKTHPASIKTLDSLGMSPLMVLLLNEKMRPEMVEELLNAHMDLVRLVGPRGMYPLHFACTTPHVPLSVFKLLCNSTTRDGRLVASVRDESHSLPCALAIRYARSDDIVMHLYERYPIKASNLRTKEEIGRLENIRDQYIKKIMQQSEASVQAFDALERHGWVSFVSGVVEGSNVAKKCVHLIEDRPLPIIRLLATYKDLHGRSAIQDAAESIKVALERRLLIFGRFEPIRGPPIHHGSTNMIIRAIDRKTDEAFKNAFEMALRYEPPAEKRRSVGEKGFRTLVNILGMGFDKAVFTEFFDRWKSDQDLRLSEAKCVEFCTNVLDNGQPREVALKFMSNTEHFRREVDLRDKLKLDSEYVVFVNDHFSHDTDDLDFSNALKLIGDEEGIDLGDYKHAIVMPLADRNLDTIFRNERPPPNEVRILAKQLAEALSYVHSRGIIHGDLKAQNVVQIGGRLRLVDFGAAVAFGSFVGAKFSSGVLPPEMIAKLTVDECARFDKYFRVLKCADPAGWAKIDPKGVDQSSFYAVKTYMPKDYCLDPEHESSSCVTTDSHAASLDSALPYELVPAAATMDVWSFGVILYALHTGSSLFDVNRDDDLTSGEAMKELFEWNESKKLTKLKNVRDPLAHRLLRKVLAKDPTARYQSMEDMLDDDYFIARWLAEVSDDKDKKAEDAIRKVTIELRNTKREILELIGLSPSVALTSFFDAPEVQCPVCFIILPYHCPSSLKNGCGNSVASGTVNLDQAFGYISFVLATVLKCMNTPDLSVFTAEYTNSPFAACALYLFLVDELTGEYVRADNLYPLDVDLKCDQVQSFLPLMAMGIRALAATNDAVGVMNMFLPGMSKDQIPRSLWAKVEAFVLESNKMGFVHPMPADDVTVNSEGRPNELREFVGYLREIDPDSILSGLRRICDKSSEKAMWVSDQSAERIEHGNSIVESDQVRALLAENSELKAKLDILALSNKKLEATNKSLLEKVKLWSERALKSKSASSSVRSGCDGCNNEELRQLREEKQVLVNEIRELSLANASLKAAKRTLEENLKVASEPTDVMQSVHLQAPEIDRNAEVKQLKREREHLIDAIKALALANSKLAWRPRDFR